MRGRDIGGVEQTARTLDIHQHIGGDARSVEDGDGVVDIGGAFGLGQIDEIDAKLAGTVQEES